LYYDRVGQGRKNSGVERVFAPGSREKHGRDQSRAHHANLIPERRSAKNKKLKQMKVLSRHGFV
jgi:hypothetical protein